MTRLKIAAIALGILMNGQALCAQGTATSEEWDAARQAKAENPQPERLSVFDRFLITLKDRAVSKFENGLAGFHPKIGSVTPGSGFGLGAEYRSTGLADGRIEILAGAQGTLLNYKRYEVGVRLPNLAGGKFSVEVGGVHRDYPREDFYGPGIESISAARTDYHLRDTAATAAFKVHAGPWFTVGVAGGVLDTAARRGADPGFNSTEDVFSAAEAPGAQSHTRFKVLSAFASADTRDEKGNPRSGSLYSASVTSYYDRKPAQFSFTEYQAEAQHYISFFNKRRVVALRARVSATESAVGQEVPFYMQPHLGGSNDLRGFADDRFRDHNSAVFNAEYRWELMSALDMAVFGDAGQVANTLSDFRLDKFKTSYGVGLRVNTAHSVFLRADLAFSRQEGRRLSLNFGHVF